MVGIGAFLLVLGILCEFLSTKSFIFHIFGVFLMWRGLCLMLWKNEKLRKTGSSSTEKPEGEQAAKDTSAAAAEAEKGKKSTGSS